MIKEVILIVVCLILGLAGAALAGGEEDSKKTKVALSADELALFEKIDAEYQHDLEVVMEEIEHPASNFDRVEIYDINGNLLKGFDLDGKAFNEQMLLPHANHVVTNSRVAVYMVL